MGHYNAVPCKKHLTAQVKIYYELVELQQLLICN